MARLAIVGAGPGGLSAARLLADQGITDVTLFEAQEEVGGKSRTAYHGGAAFEMGTCYSTVAHRLTNRWMKELGVRQTHLGLQLIDGKKVGAYVRGGPGPSVAGEALRYLSLWRRFSRDVATRPDDPEVRAECALSVDDWLTKHGFERMRRVMLRTVTMMGYGFLNEVSALQALRWSSPGVLYSGATGNLRWPLEGWQEFWRRLAQQFDVRVSCPVLGVERNAAGVALTTAYGVETFDQVLMAIPLDEASALMTLTPEEQAVRDAVHWSGYAVTTCRVDDWFDDFFSVGYTAPAENGAQPGIILGARTTPLPSPVGKVSRLYQVGQIAGDLSADALLEMAKQGIREKGGAFQHVIFQKVWKYFPRYALDAVNDGLVGKMNRLQGPNRTWWTGATFSHEAVSTITAFNAALTPRIAEALRP